MSESTTSHFSPTPKPFIVTYLTPIYPDNYKNRRDDPKNLPLKMVTEDLTSEFHHKRIFHWLSFKYNRDFTLDEVNRAMDILSLMLRKVSFCEFDDPYCDFGHEAYYVNYGLIAGNKKDYLNNLFTGTSIRLMCIDVNGILSPEDENILPLIEIICDDNKYKLFYEFWSTLPEFDGVRKLLIELGLTDDIISVIAGFLTEDKYIFCKM
jgi:hypothetical protein